MSGFWAGADTKSGYLLSPVRQFGTGLPEFGKQNNLLTAVVTRGADAYVDTETGLIQIGGVRTSGPVQNVRKPQSGSIAALAAATGFELPEYNKVGGIQPATAVQGADVHEASRYGSTYVTVRTGGTTPRVYQIRPVQIKGSLTHKRMKGVVVP